MLLWLLFAGMTAAALVAVLRPAFRPGLAVDVTASSADLAVYKDQLADLDSQVSRGQLDAEEYEALRHEVGRRILRVRAPRTDQKMLATAMSSLPMIAAVVVPIASIALYGMLGAPGVPGRPFVASDAARNPARLSDATLSDLIAKVELRLASHPEDGRGWDTIAPVYFRMERFADAANAYQQAIRILGDTPQRLAGFAEATVLANDGLVTEAARGAYEKLRLAEPGRFEARFWLALAKEQDGLRDAAAVEYRSMLAEAPADASWRGMVEQRLAGITAANARVPLKGPRDADVKAAAAMSDGDKAAMINGMVAGLAARLKANGGDLASWEKLIDAYIVLKDKDRARAALADARKALASDKAAGATLDQLSRRPELQP